MERIDRYRGCLLAGAAGDALGYPVEFDRLKDILMEHGERGVRRIGPHISDDTQMTLFTAEGMLMGMQHGIPMPECVYQSYLNWYKTQSPWSQGGRLVRQSLLMQVRELHELRAPGNTCLSALRSGDMGTVEAPINASKGCGGVMRTAPCGLVRMPGMPEDEDTYALQGAMAGAITHGHIMGYVPAAMLADIIHMILLEDGRSLMQIVLDSLERMQRLFTPVGGGEWERIHREEMQKFSELMLQAVSMAGTKLDVQTAIRELGEGWVGDEALAIGVYCALRFQDSMEDCLAAAVTHNGDSDSTGAIAGNILGAWLGVDAIPAVWLEALEMREVICGLADQLYEASESMK